MLLGGAAEWRRGAGRGGRRGPPRRPRPRRAAPLPRRGAQPGSPLLRIKSRPPSRLALFSPPPSLSPLKSRSEPSCAHHDLLSVAAEVQHRASKSQAPAPARSLSSGDGAPMQRCALSGAGAEPGGGTERPLRRGRGGWEGGGEGSGSFVSSSLGGCR